MAGEQTAGFLHTIGGMVHRARILPAGGNLPCGNAEISEIRVDVLDKGCSGKKLLPCPSGELWGKCRKGLLTHLEGCIGLGMNIGWLEGQKAVLRSRPAVIEFMNMMNREPFMLKIVNAFREAA